MLKWFCKGLNSNVIKKNTTEGIGKGEILPWTEQKVKTNEISENCTRPQQHLLVIYDVNVQGNDKEWSK